MPPPIVDGDGMPNHLREDGACSTPGPNDPLVSAGIHFFNPLEQLSFYKGSFLQRTSHVYSPILNISIKIFTTAASYAAGGQYIYP
jgi:hypothetical protein